MNKLKIFILLICIFLFQACSTLSEGFNSPKKNKSDEFLVEKKSPLKQPPNFNQLPTPTENIKNEAEELSIKNLLNDKKKNTKTQNKSNLEDLVLDKIKEN